MEVLSPITWTTHEGTRRWSFGLYENIKVCWLKTVSREYGTNFNLCNPSDGNQVMSDRILNQFGVAFGVKHFHDAVFVKGHGAGGKI